MTNQIQNVNTQTGEIVQANQVVSETSSFVVSKTPEGKFVRRAKYEDYSSYQAESREDKLWLLNIIEGDETSGFGLRENIGKKIVVEDIITRRYDSVNEDTGEIEYGVLTYLITPERDAYVTSSKTVYFSINRIMELFGRPDEDGWENITVEVGSEKGANGTIIKIRMVG